MDLVLQRFLDRVRSTARHANLAAYEDLTQALDGYLRSRQRGRTCGARATRSWALVLRQYRP
jgi:hypothetical protein